MKRALLTGLAIAGVAATAWGAARLTYNLSNRPTPVRWAAEAFPLHISIGNATAAQLGAGEALIRRAFDSWSEVDGSLVRFDVSGRTDAAPGMDGINVVTINDTLYETSGFIAFTTSWFDDKTGIMKEADIQIDASAAREGVGVQTLVQHEIGHLLGLDHSAVLSSVMFPWVGPQDLSGLDSDDRIALAAIYPDPRYAGSMTRVGGTVRSTGAPVMGAQVVALNDAGSPVASTLSAVDGTFRFDGLPPGQYRLYVEPLDGPVSRENLSGVWRDGAVTEFRTEFLGGERNVTVAAGTNAAGIEIELAKLPVELNPRWIGAFPAEASEIRLSSTALAISAGSTTAVAVGGDGFVGGLTEFEVMNPGFTRVSEFRYGPNYVWANFRIAPDSPPSSVVVLARNGDVSAALTGALRVTPGAAGRSRAVRR